eukprot:10030197-Lingulodinium_polyedra.AAC.1
MTVDEFKEFFSGQLPKSLGLQIDNLPDEDGNDTQGVIMKEQGLPPNHGYRRITAYYTVTESELSTWQHGLAEKQLR